MTEGYFRKTSHIKQKIPQNPSTVYDGSPRTERSPLPCGHLPTPWGVTPKGEALLHLGSPLGELSPQVTEGYFRETSHNKQKIPQEPLHQLRWSPSPKGEALLRLPLSHKTFRSHLPQPHSQGCDNSEDHVIDQEKVCRHLLIGTGHHVDHRQRQPQQSCHYQ